MKLTALGARNFKGIRTFYLDLSRPQNARVTTFVGLNESGKTTILEAVNAVPYRRDIDPALQITTAFDPHDLIPKGKRANFNGSISTSAKFTFDDGDNAKIRLFLKKDLGLSLSRPLTALTITHSYDFVDSKCSDPEPVPNWNITFAGRRAGSRAEIELKGDEWVKAVDFVETLLPSVLYFPSALFDFPEFIYLDSSANVDSKHRFYREVIKDILDSLGQKLDLDKHVIARLRADTPSDRRALKSVLLSMSNSVTENIFSAWNRIFDKAIPGRKLVFDCDLDSAGLARMAVRMEDGNSEYSVSERSLGFRWFFTFLLLTQYRGARQRDKNGAIFLFDEPASNLHSSAQARLLETFEKLPDNCRVLYTTHSHHLINPKWLESTFVVRNQGLDYDISAASAPSMETDVTVVPFRQFSVDYPNQTTYFQPILDTLDYQPSMLEGIPDVVMLEGKNDYYSLNYLQDVVIKPNDSIRLVPGTGSGSLDTAIRLYLAWGRKFVILLDSDKEGKKQRARYIDLFGTLVDGTIFTLEDIDPAWKGRELEDLFSPDETLTIQKQAYPASTSFDKKLFNRAVQELYLRKEGCALSAETHKGFENLLTFLAAKLRSAK